MGRITGVSRMRRKESPGAWLQSFSLGVHVGVTFSALQKNLSPPDIYAYIYMFALLKVRKNKNRSICLFLTPGDCGLSKNQRMYLRGGRRGHSVRCTPQELFRHVPPGTVGPGLQAVSVYELYSLSSCDRPRSPPRCCGHSGRLSSEDWGPSGHCGRTSQHPWPHPLDARSTPVMMPTGASDTTQCYLRAGPPWVRPPLADKTK